MEMVSVDEKYVWWQKKPTLLIETTESVKINKLRKTNELLTETINSRNKNSYVKRG